MSMGLPLARVGGEGQSKSGWFVPVNARGRHAIERQDWDRGNYRWKEQCDRGGIEL